MQSTGCCGTDFKREEISILGVATLALPLFFIGLVAVVVLWLPAKLVSALSRPYRMAVALCRANLEVIGKATLLPRLKCSLSSSAYSLSPRASGLVFRGFNLGVLVLCWSVLVGLWVGLVAS